MKRSELPFWVALCCGVLSMVLMLATVISLVPS